MLTPEQNERYQARMKRKKAIVDERIAKATEERGILILLKGNGKEYGLIVFDEMSYPLKYKNLAVEPVIEALQSRPEMQNVIITGRTMPKELEEIADTISEVRDERHAFRLGVKAQAGIEF